MAILNPYLNFRNNAREAIEFYHSIFGGDLTISTFGDFKMPGIEESGYDKVMHSQIDNTPAGFTLMASDTPAYMLANATPPSGFSVSISGDEADLLRGYWDGLADGAEIQQPLADAPWGGVFGMLVDKFGTSWLVNINAPGQA